jgi:hypothetical protein
MRQPAQWFRRGVADTRRKGKAGALFFFLVYLTFSPFDVDASTMGTRGKRETTGIRQKEEGTLKKPQGLKREPCATFPTLQRGCRGPPRWSPSADGEEATVAGS